MSKKSKQRKKERRSVAEATAKRREKAGQGFSDMFNLPKGTQMFGLDSAGIKRIDVVPYTVGKGNPNAAADSFYWERTFFAHRGVGINHDWVVCPARTAKKPCPICELAAKLQKDENADEDAVKALSPSKRMLLNVRDMKKDPETIKVWHVSHWYFGKPLDEALAAAYEDHDDNMDNFCDPDGGHYLKCVSESGFEGQGYQVARVDFVPRKEDLTDEILNQAVCLDDVLVIKPYDEIKELLYAGEEDDDADKKSKSKKGKKSKPPVDEDEDEDDEDEDEDEEDTDEEDTDDEEEEEDTDEDEDEDEENEDEEEEDTDDEEEAEDKDDDDWDEEDETPKKKTRKKVKRAKKK